MLTFFADDGRLFFVIPMGPRTCIGTTDTRVETPAAHVTDEDRRFVLDNINKRLHLPAPLTEKDVIAERCGVRPLAVAVDGGGRKTADWTQLRASTSSRSTPARGTSASSAASSPIA